MRGAGAACVGVGEIAPVARLGVNTVVEIALEISSAASRFAEQVKKHSYHGHPLDVASAQDNLNAIIEAVARAAEWLDDEGVKDE